MSQYDYDVLVLGGGPAGASALSICSWLDKRVAVVEPQGKVWPVPTGAVSKIHRACGALHGDANGRKRVPWSVVDRHLHEALARVNALPLPHHGASPTRPESPVSVHQGYARFIDPHTVAVLPSKDMDPASSVVSRVTADVILVTTGSVPSLLKGVPFDGRYVFTSDDVTSIGRTPHRIVIQGGGIIGVEYAFIMRQLGAEVVLVEYASDMLQRLDTDLSRAVLERLSRVGVRVITSAVVRFVSVPEARSGETAADRDAPDSVHLVVESRLEGRGDIDVWCDAVMVATGRRGNTADLGLEEVEVQRGRTGHIEVHSRSMWTGVAKIYAAGDCAGLSSFQPHGLVTTGQAQAIRAVYSAFVNEWPSSQLRADYFEHVPVALWVSPDVAYVGMTEAEAVARHGEQRVGASRADYSTTVKYCVEPREGFIKLVYLLDGGRIIGAHLFGEDASEMVHYAAVLVNCKHTVFEVVKEVMAGVTYQEAYRTCGLDASKRVSAYLTKISSKL